MKKSIIAIAGAALIIGSGCATRSGEPGDKAKPQATTGVSAPKEAVPKPYERERREDGKAVRQTKDGGFIVAASTDSKGAGIWDVWLLRLDAKGEIEWERTYGGVQKEDPAAVVQTRDGGYVVAATREHSAEGAKTDGWIFKVDKDGNPLWDKAFGGAGYDYFNALAETADGGLVVAAATSSKGAGQRDGWVIKLNQDGAVEWEATFGEEKNDDFKSVATTKDGGFLLAGAKGQKGTPYQDGWVVKLGSDGKKAWEKVVEGRFDDSFDSVRPTAEGGTIAVGDSQSNDEQLSNMWLVKLGRDGGLEWEKQHGDINDDRAASVVEARDGNYVLCGTTSRKLSEDEAIVTRGPWGESKNLLSTDLTVIKLGKDGTILWEKKHGDRQEGCAEIASSKDGYILAGWTLSKAKTGLDAWVVALDGNGEAVRDKVFGE